jgi:hypothetical protein
MLTAVDPACRYLEDSFTFERTVDIEFQFSIWGGVGETAKDLGADGMVMFLYDAGVPFSGGAPGSGLGYGQNEPAFNVFVNGMAGGYMAAALDTYSAWSGYAAGPYGGPSGAENRMKLRGSVVGFGNGNNGTRFNKPPTTPLSYDFIALSDYFGKLGGLLGATARPNVTEGAPWYRKAKVRIAGGTVPILDAWITFNSTTIQVLRNVSLPTISLSQQLRIGFSAGTG